MLEAYPRINPFTQCRGTAVYMPPKGLRNPPVYTTKLDCFVFGMLGVQIMTHQFPDPRLVEHFTEDARSPVGAVKIPIPDCEQHKSHIDQLIPNHLLPLSLSYSDRQTLSTGAVQPARGAETRHSVQTK